MGGLTIRIVDNFPDNHSLINTNFMHLCVVVFAGITFHYIKNVYTKSGAEKKKKKLFTISKVPRRRILGNS